MYQGVYNEVVNQLSRLIVNRGEHINQFKFVKNKDGTIDVYRNGVRASSINPNRFSFVDIAHQCNKWKQYKTVVLNSALSGGELKPRQVNVNVNVNSSRRSSTVPVPNNKPRQVNMNTIVNTINSSSRRSSKAVIPKNNEPHYKVIYGYQIKGVQHFPIEENIGISC